MHRRENTTLPSRKPRLVPTSSRPCYLYRFYEPNLQRWINRDPVGENGDINLYRLSRNDPIANIDPDGLQFAPGPVSYPPYFPTNTTASDPKAIGGVYGGNMPPAFPVPTFPIMPCRRRGDFRNVTSLYDNGICPCSGAPVRCFDFEQCEDVIVAANLRGLVRALAWVKHTACNTCPEYQVR